MSPLSPTTPETSVDGDDPETARRGVWEWLKDHFRRTSEALKIDAIVEGTALPQEPVGNALRLLADEGRIGGG